MQAPDYEVGGILCVGMSVYLLKTDVSVMESFFPIDAVSGN